MRSRPTELLCGIIKSISIQLQGFGHDLAVGAKLHPNCSALHLCIAWPMAISCSLVKVARPMTTLLMLVLLMWHAGVIHWCCTNGHPREHARRHLLQKKPGLPSSVEGLQPSSMINS